MRVGTGLNIFKIIPSILQDAFYPGTPKLFLPCLGQISELRKAGAEHIELWGDLAFIMPEMEKWWQDRLGQLALLRNEGVTFSVHLPQFSGLNIDSFLPQIRSGAVLEIKRITEFFKPLDPLYVLHLGGERFFRYFSGHLADPILEGELGRRWGNESCLSRLKIVGAKYLLHKLQAFSENFVIRKVVHKNMLWSFREIQEFIPVEKICIENLEFTNFDAVMKPFLAEMPKASVWLDVGHLMIQRWLDDKKCFRKFFKKYENNIAGLHIHEVIKVANSFYGENEKEKAVLQDHKPLGVKEGLLPLDEILGLVRKLESATGKDLPLVVELYYHNPLSSVGFLREKIEKLRNSA